MGTVWSKTAAYFQCDICDTKHTEEGESDWNGKQVTIQNARDLGWSFDSRKRTFCPQCTLAGSYTAVPQS
jgi:hypothetical protein